MTEKESVMQISYREIKVEQEQMFREVKKVLISGEKAGKQQKRQRLDMVIEGARDRNKQVLAFATSIVHLPLSR